MKQQDQHKLIWLLAGLVAELAEAAVPVLGRKKANELIERAEAIKGTNTIKATTTVEL